MSQQVFISYSSNNKKVADRICSFLEEQGKECWIAPRDVTPGKDWGEAIVDAIQASEIMVLIFSSASNNSPQVRREIEIAVSRNVRVIPFRIEDVKPSGSMEYFLSTTHWLDALNSGLEEASEELLATIERLLAEGAADNQSWGDASQAIEELRNESDYKSVLEAEDKEEKTVEKEGFKKNFEKNWSWLKKQLKQKTDKAREKLTKGLERIADKEGKELEKLKEVTSQDWQLILAAVLVLGVVSFVVISNVGFNFRNSEQEIDTIGEEKTTKKLEEGTGREESSEGELTADRNSKELFSRAEKNYGQEKYESAFEQYSKLAESGIVKAQKRLGDIYYFGRGRPEDKTKAEDWYRRAADKGDKEAQYRLAELIVSERPQEAIKLYTQAAEQGYIEAQNKLGYMYMGGGKVEANDRLAKKWHEKAAKQGHKGSQVALGAIYKYGLGVKVQEEKAKKWYRKAAGQGSETAKEELKELTD